MARRIEHNREDDNHQVLGIFGLLRLIAGRARAMPSLLGVRIIGTLLAATLVGGVSLYSVAMGDAMLRSYLARDLYNTSYVGTSYIALGDGSLKRAEPRPYSALDQLRGPAGAAAWPCRWTASMRTTIRRSAACTTRPAAGAPAVALLDRLPIEYYGNLASRLHLLAGGSTCPSAPRLPMFPSSSRPRPGPAPRWGTVLWAQRRADCADAAAARHGGVFSNAHPPCRLLEH